jgi:hypothetical protein
MDKRYPMALTVKNLALILRALSRVEDEDVSDATALGDELTNIDAMTAAGMSEEEIRKVMEEGS